jgi:putative nucleotidyltransferase with HDIG domain
VVPSVPSHLGAARTAALRLLAALGRHDPATAAHSLRVAALTRRLARELRLPPRTAADLELGALLHDLGKLGVSRDTLGSGAPLHPPERAAMDQHPFTGARLVAAIPALHPAAAAVLCHHERWDGSGYPQGLAAHDIPLTARVCQVADAYDAIVSDRPYRDGRAPASALDEIARAAGTQFDPAVTAALSRMAPGLSELMRPGKPAGARPCAARGTSPPGSSGATPAGA